MRGFVAFGFILLRCWIAARITGWKPVAEAVRRPNGFDTLTLL